MAGAGAGGGRHWLAGEAPGFRHRMLQKILTKLAQFYQGKYSPSSPELQSFVAKIEEGAFNGANSKEDYMRSISSKLVGLEKRRRQEQQQQMQIRSQMRPANLHGGNSSVTAMPQVTRMPSSQPTTTQTSGLVPKQYTVYPYMPDMMPLMDQFLNFQPTTAFTPVAPGVQQSVPTLCQTKHPAGQLQPANFSGCRVTKIQGRPPVVRPNSQQNHLLGQNVSDIGTQQQQQQEMDMQRHQMLGAQQGGVAKMQDVRPGGWNNKQSAGLTDVLRSPLKASKPEPMAPPQQQITGGQQSSLLRQSSQVLASTGEADLMETMFQQIKFWKDAYFLEFMELERRVVVPKLTEDQFRSLPKEKADEFKQRVCIKKTIRRALDFLQLQKSNVPEGLNEVFPKFKSLIQYLVDVIGRSKARIAKMNTGHQLQNCREQPQIINLTGDATPFTGGESRQQEQPADASILQSRQTILTRTPPAHQQIHINHLLGLASPSFPISSPGALQSLPTNKLECLTPSPIAKSEVVPVAPPCASVKSTLSEDDDSICAFLLHDNAAPPPLPAAAAAKANGSNQVTPTKPTMSASPLQAETTVGQAEKPINCLDAASLSEDDDSISAFLLHDNAAPPPPAEANGSNQVTPSKPTMSASPLQAETTVGQAEDQVPGGAETLVAAKKPIDRLIDAMRSSSPAALRSSVNSIWSVVNMSDSVPHGRIGAFLDWTLSQQHGRSNALNKMKRVFDHTTPRSEYSMDGSCVTIECDALDSGSSSERSVKRQKKQDANDALLEEIEAINNTLIDTVISVTGDCGTDGITSCNGGGTTIKLSYCAVALSSDLKSLFATSEMSLVMPAKLFVPADYPRSSPVLVTDRDEQLRKKFSDISDSVDVAFRHALSGLPEPRSIKETARAWEACVRKAVTEFAHRYGGGTISSRLSRWERCSGE